MRVSGARALRALLKNKSSKREIAKTKSNITIRPGLELEFTKKLESLNKSSLSKELTGYANSMGAMPRVVECISHPKIVDPKPANC